MRKFKKTIPVITTPDPASGFKPELKLKHSKPSKIETIVTLLTRPKPKGKAALDTTLLRRPFAWLTPKPATGKNAPPAPSKFAA